MPENVRFIKMSFADLRARIQSVFDFPISFETPYKLCDFKTAYGEIFAEELRGFDFWGYCDCDLVFGKIRKFLTDEILCAHDRIFSRGHMTLIRNTLDATSLYKEKIDGLRYYRDAFSSSRPFCFDEWGGSSCIWKKLRPDKFFDEKLFDDISIGQKHFVLSKWLQFNMRAAEKRVAFVWRSDGSLFRVSDSGKTETLYVHFQKRPMKIVPACENGGADAGYVFVPNKVFPFVSDEDVEVLRRRYCKRRLFYFHYWRVRYGNLVRKIRRAISKK